MLNFPTTRRLSVWLLVSNEDCQIEQVLENTSAFCERIIVADNLSDDGISVLIKKMCEERYEHVESSSEKGYE